MNISGNRRRFVDANFYEEDLFLMVDDRLIASHQGVTWELCPLQKAESPVLSPIARWEGGDGKTARPVHQDPLDGSVLWDAEREHYVAWYRTHNRLLPASDYLLRETGRIVTNPGRDGSNYCMAISKNGIVWEKPEVGAVLFEGSYANNLVPASPFPVLEEHISGILPNHLDDGKFPLVATVYSKFSDPIYPYGITHMHSEDGVQWRPYYPPPLPLDGDAHCLMWDPRQKCYICTTRSAQHSRIFDRLRRQGLSLKRKRHIALAKSRDLIHWTPMLDVLEVDAEDPSNAEFYSMYILPYGNVYLGFLDVFYVADGMAGGPLEVQLALSYDLDTWYRAARRQPVLARGSAGSWDSSHVHLFSNTPFVEGNLLRFWYGGKDTEHWQAGNAGIGTATLRRDGFACWSAGREPGVLTTVAFKAEWATWPMLNVEAENGEVRMEILSEDGNPIEGCSYADCLPIVGNHLRAQVQYRSRRGNFVRYNGRIRFRFHLRNAKLYAFRAPQVFHAEGDGARAFGGGNLWL